MQTDCLATIQFAQIVIRGLALLLVGIGGMVCIHLGGRLYLSAISSKVAGELSTQGLRVKLSAASPGIFMVAFGAYLLVTVAQHRFQDKRTEEIVEMPNAHGSAVEAAPGWMSAHAAQPPAPAECTCPPQRACLLSSKKTSETSYIGGAPEATQKTLREDLSSLRTLLEHTTPTDQTERIRLVKATQALVRLETLAKQAAEDAP